LGTDCVRWELNANHATSAGSQREARTGDPGQEIARPDHLPPGRILPPPAGGIRHDRRAGPEHPPRLVSRMTCRSAVVFLPCRILVASAPGSELKRVNGHCYVAVNRPSRAFNGALTASGVLSTLRPNLSWIHPGSIHSVRSSSFELFSSFELSSFPTSFPNLSGRQLSNNMFSSHASINPSRSPVMILLVPIPRVIPTTTSILTRTIGSQLTRTVGSRIRRFLHAVTA